MTLDARHSVDQGLHHLAGRLDPIIEAKLRPSLNGLLWATVLTELDRMRGKPRKSYTSTDLQSQLKVITERLGTLGFPFDDYTRLVSTLGSELRILRNRWAHHDELTSLDAWRGHDFTVRLLEHFGDVQGVASAGKLRDKESDALAEEKGVARHVAQAGPELVILPKTAAHEPVFAELISPDPVVMTRADTAGTPTIGPGRLKFEPWPTVLVGDFSVLDDLPKKVAKEAVRAVATEIAEFEGPIHVDRLAQLTAASFGVQRPWPAREKKLTYQIRQTGLMIDDDKFVWPSDLDPRTWSESRPNDSTIARPFTEVSPVEIANAMRTLLTSTSANNNTDLDAATLRTFGRKRKTKQCAVHLERARRMLSGPRT